MLDLLRAWDLAKEDLLLLHPDDDLASAVKKLLERAETHSGSPCGIVQDENGRFLGTLSTHRALRAIGAAIEEAGIFASSRQINMDRAVHALCRMVGGHTVRDHMYTKVLEVAPHTPLPEILRRFADSMGHFAVVTEAGRALGLLELDDVFKTFAASMLSEKPINS